MKSSTNLLFKQFCDAKGYTNKSIDNTMKEFFDWIYTMSSISKYYTDFLDEMGFDFKNNKCAELSKSFFDTVVKEFDTHLITLYENGLNDIDNKRVVDGNLVINDMLPLIIRPTTDHFYLTDCRYDTFMTQNPYQEGDFRKLSVIHNRLNYNIIGGVFGFIDDKDRAKKVRSVKNLRDSLYGDFIFELDKKDDIYFCCVGSKTRVRK